MKTSELVDCAWTKNDKHERSPNLLKMSRHITNVSSKLINEVNYWVLILSTNIFFSVDTIPREAHSGVRKPRRAHLCNSSYSRNPGGVTRI